MTEKNQSKKLIPEIKSKNSEDKLISDLEKYCKLAVEMGATAAKFIKTDQIPIDDRVALKCIIPVCFNYNTCANCPPHSLKPEETRQYLKLFKWAVVFKKDILPEDIVRNKKTTEEKAGDFKNDFEIVNKLESAAFYDGYYFSAGFGAGSCKSTFCPDQECLILQNKKCRYSLRARPSMEAVGMDCFKLAVDLGWHIIPIGSGAKAEEVSHGSLMGLVLID